jgi:hypothetical protein
MFKAKFEGTASPSKQQLDIMGDSAAHRQIGSKTSYGEG